MNVLEMLDGRPRRRFRRVAGTPREYAVATERPLRRCPREDQADESVGHSTASRLRDGGHDVDTIRDENLAGAADDDVYAAAESDTASGCSG
jgi:neutral trehalase